MSTVQWTDVDGNQPPTPVGQLHTDASDCTLICVRTTINLPTALAEAAKARAAAEGRTFTSLVEEGLRAVLQERAAPPSTEPLPAYGHSDRRLLVDLTNREAVWAALDADGAR